MTGLDRLKSAFEAFAAGRATPEQDSVIRAAIASGAVRIVSGERAAQIGRDANGATIVTGDGNTILSVTPGDIADLLKALAAERRRVDHLPADLPDFEGRETEIEKLCTVLRAGGQAAITAIGGMGGIGKSALAVHVAHEVASDIAADGVLYIELGGVSERPLTAVDAMADVIATFDPRAPKPTSEREAVAGFRGALHGKQVLLLLDNAKDANTVVPLFEHRSLGCTILVTSREKIVWPGVAGVALEEMTRGEARKLLRAIVGEARATDEQLDEIARHCGCLPLALRVAGSFLARHPNWPVGDYLQALADERGRLAKLKLKGMPKLDVAAVLGFSARQLAGEDRALAERWQALAVFVESFDLAAAAAVWDLRIGEALEVLSELVARSMVRFDPETSRYRLHDLIRDVAQLPLEGQDAAVVEAQLESARARHARHYCTVLATAGELYSGGSEAGLALYDLEQRNIGVGQAWASAHIDEDRRAALCAANYAGSASVILMLRMHPRGRLTWHEAQRVACAKLGVRRGECAALNMMGVALSQLAELQKGVNCLRQSLHIAREIGVREAEGSALCNLGLAYVQLGRAQDAIDRLGECLEIARDLGNIRQEANALGGLGNACLLLDDPLQAIGYHQQRWALARSTGDRKGEGNALGNIGSAWLRSGEPGRALEFYKRALAIAREIGDRQGETTALGSIGLGLVQVGEPSQACRYLEEALSLSREIGDRIGEGNALFNSALALDQLGERAEALRRTREALAIFEAIGAKHLVEKARAQLTEWGADDAPG